MLQGALPRAPGTPGSCTHTRGGVSSAQLSVGSLAPWAWPGNAPRRRGLQKGVEELLSSITREGGERFGKMLGGKLAMEATGPGDCQPWGTHLSSRWGQEGHCPALPLPLKRPSPSPPPPRCFSRECSPSTRRLNHLRRAKIELGPFQALRHPGSINNPPAEGVSLEKKKKKRFFMSIPQTPLPQKPSGRILSQL